MFGKRITLFELLGFEVRIDLSWIIIAVLITWSLSKGVFPYYYRHLSNQTYWLMGIAGAFGFFLSIVVHEFSHSLVARHHGMPMTGITLFIFGGVAEMEDEPPNAKSEFIMAVAGPLSSIVIAAIFYASYFVGSRWGWPGPVNGVIGYLSWINGILAAFNLLPAFPLDGGRVLRSILWGVKKDLRWATRITSWIGSAFGILLIIYGAFNFLRGNFIGGMWWFLIGIFLRSAAQMSYKQLLTRKALEGEHVSRFMKDDPVAVPPDISVDRLVEEYIYKYHFNFFPVVDLSDRLIGSITTNAVKKIPREEWPRKSVAEAATQYSEENTIKPQEDAVKALSRMNTNNVSRLMVVDRGRLVGVIALKDMLKFLALKMELNE
jgi:Zn-dependent protease/CBS domain-containing protein